MVAYEVTCALIDEYLRMNKITCREPMYKFCKAMIAVLVRFI
jgi:hypothetical protein